ncbi:MAG TPA: tetratricopeptide repeat protein, partial [Rhodanobacteraceae bacterium]|nr:tetratricopeptide repeat protein [Rhodanobacteraceae bacterium]
MANKPGFFDELSRRHVWRAIIAYAAIGWIVIQLVTQLFPVFELPPWTVRAVVLAIAIGFPVVAVLAWVVEITPQGLRRTAPAHSLMARDPTTTRRIGRRIDLLIILVLLLAVGLLLLNTFYWQRAQSAPGTALPAIASANVPHKSVAVLPFENLSADKDNEYFVAGMQDLILTKLADIGQLKVISRTSTMKYQSRPSNLRRVAAELGVATVLEGSVQKQGDQVLINVQLIDAATDAHLWADSYTRRLDNIFGVEGEVAEKIAAALSAKLSPTQSAQLSTAPTSNQAAYDLFLRAQFQLDRGNVNYDTANWKAAIPLFRQAVAADPNFALAWARLSRTESVLAWFGGGGEDPVALAAQARLDATRARQLAPQQAAAHIAIGYSDYWGQRDYAAALAAFNTALTLRPNDADALAARGYVERRQGDFDRAIDSLQQALAHDPRNSALAYEVGITCMMASRYRESETWFANALTLDPDNVNARYNQSYAILLGSGDLARALAAAKGSASILKLQRITVLTYMRRYTQALALLESIPDNPDTFSVRGGSKALQLAELHRLNGDVAKSRALFAAALPIERAQLAVQRGNNLLRVWQFVARAELGLGQVAAGVTAIDKAQSLLDSIPDQVNGPLNFEF